MDIVKGKPMREKLILFTVFVALLVALGFLSYQVYERDKAIYDLQMSVSKAEIVLGLCKRANEGLKEKIEIQDQSRKQVRGFTSDLLGNY
jgi:hypothetical protein